MRLFTGNVIYIKLHEYYIWTFFFFFFFGTASTLPVIHIYTLKSVTLYYQFHLFYKKKFVSRNKIQKVSLKC